MILEYADGRGQSWYCDNSGLFVPKRRGVGRGPACRTTQVNSGALNFLAPPLPQPAPLISSSYQRDTSEDKAQADELALLDEEIMKIVSENPDKPRAVMRLALELLSSNKSDRGGVTHWLSPC